MFSEMFSKADMTAAQRRRLAGTGAAMPDGSFPIRNRMDLRNAIQSVGRASDYEAAKKHIISRARAIGATAMLPKEWNVTKSWGLLFQPKFSK